MYEVLFSIGPLPFRTMNILVVLGFLFGVYILWKLIQRNKMNQPFVVNYFVQLTVLPLLVGRLIYGLEHPAAFFPKIWQFLYIWDLKLSAFGLLYGFLITLFFVSRHEQEDFWAWFDVSIIAGTASLVWIHIGHFFNGSHYGKPTDLPWGIPFDTLVIPFTNPIHPTQLYSALAAFVIYGMAMRYSRRTHLSGMAGSLTLMLYSVLAFGIDFLKGTPSPYAKTSYLVIAAISFIFYIHNSYKTHHDRIV